MSCSLLDIVGGVCGAEEATSVFLQFSGVETEIEPILARSGVLLKPVNSSETTVSIKPWNRMEKS